MDILPTIIDAKLREVAERRSLYPVKLLEKSIYFSTPPLSLKKYLLRGDKSGIIAEIKRKSPSKGILNSSISIEQISIGYMQAGASAISILTDQEFFGGSNADLTEARRYNFCPILRKEFILDEYQVLESKSIGADAVLLIVSIISRKQLMSLSALARSLGMEVLVEIHNQEELQLVKDLDFELMGVNNRDLHSFKTHLETSMELSGDIPERFIKVSESGIRRPEDIQILKEYGYAGFLIGELFMRHSRPEEYCKSFIERLNFKMTV